MAPKLLLSIMVLSLTTALSSAWKLGAREPAPGPVQFVIPDGAKDEEDKNSCLLGVFGDCRDDDPVDDFEDPALMRRHLMWNSEKYISYSALRKNFIPCAKRGSSYYNCRQGRAVNPYHRGCSAITMCARVW